jgi:exosome complex component RRP42
MTCLTEACSSPSASQAFEGRGADEFNLELTQIVSRVYSSNHCGLDLDALCIIPGQQCWIVYVDALVRVNSKAHQAD